MKPGAAIGASLAVVDSGWSRTTSRFDKRARSSHLSFASRWVSGAIQHVAGMKSSKTIVAS